MYLSTVFSALFTLSLATPTLSSCPSRIIRDGGFESTFEDAWNVLTFPASNFELTRPGSTNHGSKHAFTALAYPGPFSDGGAILSQDLRTCAGKNYSVTADYRFSQENDDCEMRIDYPFKDARGSVTVGGAVSPAGIWYTTGSTFQAVSSASKLEFYFRCKNRAENKISVDNVKVKEFNGNAY